MDNIHSIELIDDDDKRDGENDSESKDSDSDSEEDEHSNSTDPAIDTVPLDNVTDINEATHQETHTIESL